MNLLKKTISGCLAGVMLVLALSACGVGVQMTKSEQEPIQTVEENVETKKTDSEKQLTNPAAKEGYRIILDDDGQEVEIPNEVKSCVVVGIYPLSAAISNYLGSGEKIIGMDEFAKAAAVNGLLGKLYPELKESHTDFMKGDSLNVESLLALKPDVVFFSAKNQQQREILKNAGIPAIGVHAQRHGYNCIQTYNDWFNLFNRVFPGEGPSSSEVTAYSQNIYNKIQERIKNINENEKVRALSIFRYTDDGIMVSGANFFGNWWIETTGGVNVAKDIQANGAQPINMEQILAWNPEIIFITNFSGAQPEDLYENAIHADDWSSIHAVVQKRVYKMPLASYRTFTPGVDTPVTLLWTAKCMYPEYFEDVDIAKEFKDYYKSMFDIELTAEDVDSILNPPREAAGKFQ